MEDKYNYLEQNPDKGSRELFVKGSGIRASTLWHDRYVSRQHPDKIAQDRDIPVEAVREALAYCQDTWDVICDERDRERERLHQKGFFEAQP